MGKMEFWTVAYRKRADGTLLPDDRERAFRIIPNTWRYWCGDPHLFDYHGHAYVFAELYDLVLRRGVIGCCEITDEGCTPWRVVLKMPWHLSYPHVFERDGIIYMIPESYVGKEIALYEAVEFPWKWKKARVLKGDYVAVDTTRFIRNGAEWLLTLQFEDSHEYLRLFPMTEEGPEGDGLIVSADDPNKRPGGKLYEHRGRLLRPAQDCTESYGCALNFYAVSDVSRDGYREELIAKLHPSDIRTDFTGEAAGLHTYNFSERYEVVDLKHYEFDPLFYLMRPIWYVWRRVRKVFGR